MIKAVYVVQYGAWWKLTPTQWRELLESGIRDGGHFLPENRQLAARPRKIRNAARNDERPSYWSLDENILIASPLDWEEEAYRYALSQLDERSKAKSALSE